MQVHFPEDDDKLKNGKIRILTNQLISQQLALQLYQQIRQKRVAPKIKPNIAAIKKDLIALPFTLTNDQKRALWDIIQDLETGKPMQRLLLGDVGSGKTVVALLAAASCIRSKVQVALLAPTEILAQQHFANLQKLSTKLSKSIICGLYTQSDQQIADEVTTKAKMKKAIAEASVNLIIGTHALLQEDIHFNSLGLAIIDEQHRFGVEQRGALLNKNGKDNIPHLLSMTATPIPRSLALSWYQELPVSAIKQLPTGRQPIITRVVDDSGRENMYQHIAEEIKSGRQAFVVLPRVEENDTDDTKSVKDEFGVLQKRFPKLKLAMIYGKMKSKDKDQLMQDMAQGKIDLLVASSVIEIGIDIPNTSVIVIENAEHFGLAQLHQLRGRIGRGQHKSYCYVTTNDIKAQSERLNTFATTTDGFKLAEMDLKQRGFGNLFGKEQTGFSFNFNDELSLEALQMAGKIAQELLSVDETLQTFPQLADKALPLLEKLHLE
jgi:ATP-dependent DNA helicase RecG